MAEWIRTPSPRSTFIALFLMMGMALLEGCRSGSEITEYQAPAQILRAFRTQHPGAQAISYRQMTKDGVKVYWIEYLEGEEEREAWYNVQGQPFVSKSERRAIEQERQKELDEKALKAQEEADEKAAQSAESPHESEPKKATAKAPLPSSGHGAVP